MTTQPTTITTTPTPTTITALMIDGPFDKPNGTLQVRILGTGPVRFMYQVEVIAVITGLKTYKVGDLLTVHMSKLMLEWSN